MTRPSHHRPGGGFRNPWPEAAGDDALRKRFRRVAWEWLTRRLPPDPPPGALPLAVPGTTRLLGTGDPARITWVGHSTFLIQLPGLNLLTDPVWSERASPVQFSGARRFVPAKPDLDDLPPIDGVLLSHDHYDHLDRGTVVRLHERFGSSLDWLTPLGYSRWFRRLGVQVRELDWWDEVDVDGRFGPARILAAPARHWTRRTPWDTNRRLWCSWVVSPSTPGAPRVYFGGDSGAGSVFSEIGARVGPFDVSILPIGAYDPRWFMKASHMNPEEAIAAFDALGGRGLFLPAHWGTFRLTFEDPLEPPERLRAGWTAADRPDATLRVLRHGETLVLGS